MLLQQELKLSDNYPILDGIYCSSIDIFPNQSIKVIHNTKEWYVIHHLTLFDPYKIILVEYIPQLLLKD